MGKTTTTTSNLNLQAKDNVSKTLRRLSGTFQKFTGKINKTTKAFGRMQLKTFALRKSLKKVGKSMRGIGKSMSTSVTLPIVAAGAGIISMAAKFEKSMNKVRALTGATGEDFKKMRDLAKKLGITTQFSASEAADAMSFLGMAGFDTNQILTSTPSLLKLAAASGIELARAADIASNVMGGFGLKASEAGRVADVLANTTASSNVNMEQLAESMKVAAPLGKQFGASIEEVSTAIGLLGNVGIQGSDAGTALKRAFLALSAPGSKASKMLGIMGVKATDAKGNMRDFSAIMEDFGKKSAKFSQSENLKVLNEIFGKIGISGAAALIEATKSAGGAQSEFDRLTKKIKASDGVAAKMAKTMQEGAAGGMKKFMSAIEGLAIAIGDSGVLQMFTDLVTGLAKFTQSIAKTNPWILKIGSLFAVVVAAIGPLLVAFGMVAGAMPAVISGSAAIGTGIAAIGTAIAGAGLTALGVIFSPLGAIIAGVGIALASLWKVFELGRDIWRAFADDPAIAWKALKATFKDMFPMVSSIIGLFGDAATSVANFTGLNISGSGDKSKKRNFAPVNNDVKNFVLGGSFGKDKGIKTPNVSSSFGKNREIKTPKSQLAKTQVTVDFKNLPKGSKVKSEGTKNSNLNLNLGFQGVGS